MRGIYFRTVLLFCFIAPVASTLFMLQYQKKQIKRELKRKLIAGIDKSELVLLKFSTAQKEKELEWEHAKEFKYKGEFYDVVEKKEERDSVFYWCWWDYEETRLYKKLDELVASALGMNSQQKDNIKRLHDFFKSLYFSAYPMLNSSCFFERDGQYVNYSSLYQSLFYSPPFPPPKFG